MPFQRTLEVAAVLQGAKPERKSEVPVATVKPKLVVVAAVPVAFKNVKFCKLVEPETVKVLVATKLPAVSVPEIKESPWTENRLPGEVVPMPTSPATPEIRKKGDEVPWSPTTKIGVPVPTSPAVASIENCPQGLEVPTPRMPVRSLVEEANVTKSVVVVAFVPVAFTKVKFCKVVEPKTVRLVSTFRAVVEARV